MSKQTDGVHNDSHSHALIDNRSASKFKPGTVCAEFTSHEKSVIEVFSLGIEMGLKESLATTTVSQLNIRPPVTIQKSASVREAVQIMRDAGMGCVIVVDDDDRAVGIFTEGILRHELNDSPTVLDDNIEAQMAERLPWVSPSDPAGDILDTMEEFNIRFLAVLDDDHHVIGLTGQKTIIEFVAETFPHEVLTQDPTSQTISPRKEGA